MANPFDSPTTKSSACARSPIGDDVVARLIDGRDTETLAFYDVSDCQIYGRKHRQKLSGVLADAAKSAGCEPIVYQTVLWWCLVYMPVVPLGTYFVIPCVECDDPDGDAEQYRGVRAELDSSQIAVQYSVVVALLTVVGLVWSWLRSRG